MSLQQWSESRRVWERRIKPECKPKMGLLFRSNSAFRRSRGEEPDRRKPPGFTLIELLVVIAIIAVLAGLLLPVLSGAKAKGKMIVCKNNLRQLAMVLLMYADDHGSYPTDTIAYDAKGRRRDGYDWVKFFGPLQAYLYREGDRQIGFTLAHNSEPCFTVQQGDAKTARFRHSGILRPCNLTKWRTAIIASARRAWSMRANRWAWPRVDFNPPTNSANTWTRFSCRSFRP